jgi:hypothetical protein
VCGAAALAVPGVADAGAVFAARGAVLAAGSRGRPAEAAGLGALNVNLTGGPAAGRAAVRAQPAEPAGPASYFPPPSGSLGSVSCVGASFCLGVGPYGVDVGRPTFSQIWNGTSWRTVTVPSNPSDGLFGVACRSARYCLAVGGVGYNEGSQLSDEWNGKSWRKLPPPEIPGNSELTGVACPAAHECIAVGTSGFPGSTAAAQVWDGTSWAVTAPAIPAGARFSALSGVACSGPSHCLAVGTYYTSKTQLIGSALAESWNGHSWTLLPSPANVSAFNAVSCPAAKVCVGAGAGTQGFDGELSIASAWWNGSSWTPLTMPSPGNGTQSLYGISCTSPANCVTVGSGPNAIDDGIGVGPFAEQWTGGPAWSLEPVPGPKVVDFAPDGAQDGQYSLSSISCTSPARCMAVGGTGGSLAVSAYTSLAVRWNGRDWSVSRTGKVDGLMGVSCDPRGACLVTGTYLDSADVTRTLVESWNGSRMRLISPNGLKGVMSAISCPSASFCAAATGSGVASWNGRRWNWSAISRTVYNVPGYPIYLLSCTSRDFCMATGGWQIGFGEAWNGKVWNSASFAVPQAGDFYSPIGLSCVSPDFCLADGSYSYQDNSFGGFLAEVWSGRAWRIIPIRGLSRTEVLGAVTCRTRTNCMAIGQDSAGGKTTLFGASWNGHVWTVTKIPGSYGSNDQWLGGANPITNLSCPTATSCVAVYSVAPFKPRQSLAYSDIGLIWNGHSWRRTKAGGPQGITSVSCASASDCVAIGLPNITTLAKLWNGSTWKIIKTINP